MILHGPQIWRWVENSAGLAQRRAYISSAYVTSAQFERLAKEITPDHSHKKIFVRWQLKDLLSGASDLKSYEIARAYGWQFFVNLQLHAKTYLFDHLCAVGSANLTRNGMKGVPPANREMLAQTTDIVAVEDWFAVLEKNSIELDESLFTQIAAAVEQSAIDNSLDTDITYDEALQKALSPEPSIALFTHDLFWTEIEGIELYLKGSGESSRDIEHDLWLLNLSHPRRGAKAFQSGFVQSKAFMWLLKNVQQEAYFGELSRKLHGALQDDPAPFRKDVKILLNNLLEWTKLFGDDYFVVDRPNVSQRIIRK